MRYDVVKVPAVTLLEAVDFDTRGRPARGSAGTTAFGRVGVIVLVRMVGVHGAELEGVKGGGGGRSGAVFEDALIIGPGVGGEKGKFAVEEFAFAVCGAETVATGMEGGRKFAVHACAAVTAAEEEDGNADDDHKDQEARNPTRRGRVEERVVPVVTVVVVST